MRPFYLTDDEITQIQAQRILPPAQVKYIAMIPIGLAAKIIAMQHTLAPMVALIGERAG